MSQPTSSIRVCGFDHLVLWVDDVERSLAFYLDELGLAPVRVDQWRRGEVFFPSVRIDATSIIDLLQCPPGGRPHPEGRNVDHFCLVVEDTDLHAVADSGRFTIVDGPDRRFGAQGDGNSLYVRDPDGNVVELRHYGPAVRVDR